MKKTTECTYFQIIDSKNLKLINIGDEGYYDWFIDESHFSLKGHQEITKLLQPIFENSIDLTNESSKKTRK